MDPIVWNVDPELLRIGSFSLRYYSLLFAGGLVLGYMISSKIFVDEGFKKEDIEKLAFFIFVATILGARLGHCLFYEPEYYLSHPLEMILPYRIDGGKWTYTGFQGLASHGGIFAVFLAIMYWWRRTKNNLLQSLDIVSVGGALTGAFIRLANFMNSEIVGKPTDGNFGVVFKQNGEDFPRHPGQLYESLAYFAIFGLLFFLYKKKKDRFNHGFLFGLFFTLLFIARFFIEFVKENQVAFEEGMSLNMGQKLSIPFIIGGVVLMFLRRKKQTIT